MSSTNVFLFLLLQLIHLIEESLQVQEIQQPRGVDGNAGLIQV
jgi:hypothetical protein